MGVFLYAADWRSLDYERAYDACSEDRRRKTDRLARPEDKCRSVAAERLLAAACRAAGFGEPPLCFSQGEHGKPAFAGQGPCFNLSHAGDFVLCAVSDGAVGCDIETVRPIDRAVADRFFHPDEIALLGAAPPDEQTALFYRLWTRKESYLKATGEGMSRPLSSFAVLPVPRLPDGGHWYFKEFSWDGYAVSLCSASDPAATRLEILKIR